LRIVKGLCENCGLVAAQSFGLLLSRLALAQGEGPELNKTLYQVKTDLRHDYLQMESLRVQIEQSEISQVTRERIRQTVREMRGRLHTATFAQK
jgi:hypothetical protein